MGTMPGSVANNVLPRDRNIVMTIHNVTQGLRLDPVSQYPSETEFVLPPFSMLRVQKIVRGKQGKYHRMICIFENSLMSTNLCRSSIEEDLKSVMQQLWVCGSSRADVMLADRKRQNETDAPFLEIADQLLGGGQIFCHFHPDSCDVRCNADNAKIILGLCFALRDNEKNKVKVHAYTTNIEEMDLADDRATACI